VGKVTIEFWGPLPCLPPAGSTRLVLNEEISDGGCTLYSLLKQTVGKKSHFDCTFETLIDSLEGNSLVLLNDRVVIRSFKMDSSKIYPGDHIKIVTMYSGG